ncbi:DUF3068 domain-containing protein [Marinactinospora rubrisoli]|uniref:DUF3068 domain-containing protein n=1 Tax=Marinactinospora rubrisoli TaxID=2715399 RepID=A0ABW2KC16_9ACTN
MSSSQDESAAGPKAAADAGTTGAATGSARRADVPALLVAAGAFLVTLALLLRFPVHGQLARLPDGGHLTWRLEAASARYLDTTTWRTREDAELVRRIDAVGAPVPGAADRAAWNVSATTSGPDGTLGHLAWRVTVDRESGETVACCGGHVGGDHSVRPGGLGPWWPPGGGEVERPVFDPDLRTAVPAAPGGADVIAGVPTERYVQTVGPAVVPEPARPVPASLFGSDARGTVGAARWVAAERVYWVEPVTGRVVQMRERRTETLRPVDGEIEGDAPERVLLAADFRTPLSDATANATAAGRRADLLTSTRTALPAGLAGIGALLILAGFVRRAAAGRTADGKPSASGRRTDAVRRRAG